MGEVHRTWSRLHELSHAGFPLSWTPAAMHNRKHNYCGFLNYKENPERETLNQDPMYVFVDNRVVIWIFYDFIERFFDT